jgi:GNAT superfamily N-acetyltransferase
MRHPEKACPATTLYRSVQARGVVESFDDPTDRAHALQALMEKLQPEGGHLPLDAAHPLYRSAIRGLGMWAIRIDSLSAVSKVGDHLTDPEARSVLSGLWKRGEPGDLAAIEVIAEATGKPWWPTPTGTRPRCHPSLADATAAAELVAGEYWNGDFTVRDLAEAVRRSAWVGLESDGRLVATARAISDGFKRSWIYDVAVAIGWRGRGLGSVVMGMLLDHPDVRRTQASLGTRDAMAFYERLGFERVHTDADGPYPRTLMARPRGPTA